jgi:hypothetical protein
LANTVSYDANFRNYPVQTVVFVGPGGWVQESTASFPYSPIQYSVNKISETESEILFQFPPDAIMVNIALGKKQISHFLLIFLGNPASVNLADLEWHMDEYPTRYRGNQLGSFEGRYVMAFYASGIPGKQHRFFVKSKQSLSIDLVTTYVQITEDMKKVMNVLPSWTIPSPFMQSVHSVSIVRQ